MTQLGQADIVGEFCGLLNVPDGICGFLRLLLDKMGFSPEEIEKDLREKGKDKLCQEVVDIIGADFPGGRTAAKKFCDNLLDRLERRLLEGLPDAPDAPTDGTRRARYGVVTAQRINTIKAEPASYPPGSVAIFDSAIRKYRVLSPPQK